MIRLARPEDRGTLREIQTSLREPNPALLAYAIDGPPVVLVSTTPESDIAGYLVALHDEETSYVAEIVVAPQFRREGRARLLLATAFDHLRECDCTSVRLSVHPDNDAARRLYESMGFEEVGREEEYYDDGSAAMTMERDL